jgi:hypothetical protein
LNSAARRRHFEEEALHLRHEMLKLSSQAHPLVLHLLEAPIADGTLQLLGGAGGMARSEDKNAALQLQQSSPGAIVVSRGDGGLQLLHAYRKFAQKKPAEMNQQLGIASGVVQRVVAVEKDRVVRFGFDVNSHEIPLGPPAGNCSNGGLPAMKLSANARKI